jgi:hypothetical protein
MLNQRVQCRCCRCHHRHRREHSHSNSISIPDGGRISSPHDRTLRQRQPRWCRRREPVRFTMTNSTWQVDWLQMRTLHLRGAGPDDAGVAILREFLDEGGVKTLNRHTQADTHTLSMWQASASSQWKLPLREGGMRIGGAQYGRARACASA